MYNANIYWRRRINNLNNIIYTQDLACASVLL